MKLFDPDEFYSRKLFFERHEFAGVLSKGDKFVKDLHIVVQYSKIKEGNIVGKILGNVETAQQIEALSESPGKHYVLSTKSSEYSGRSFSSDNMFIERIINKPSYGTNMHFKIAELRFLELSIEETVEQREKEDRKLIFFLSGPEKLWDTYENVKLSFTGEEKIEIDNSKIELNEQFPFDIETRSWYFYEKDFTENKYRVKTQVQVLSFTTKISQSILSDEDFLALAKPLADDLILLISFLSRRWVVWYRYEFYTNDKMYYFIKHTRECSSMEMEPDDSIIEGNDVREFIKKAITELRKLRQANIDLYMSLVYYVSANEAKYLEEKFSVLFLSLERIKDMFTKKNKIQKIYQSSIFEKVSDTIYSVLTQNLGCDPKLKLLKEKLPELNRPALRHTLDLLFKQYDVNWCDLYPKDNEFTLIKTRDRLFHSSSDLPIDLLGKEKLRLQSLLERLLLSMLGWKNPSHTPFGYKRNWLQETE
jgi:hypothetical protein